MAGLARATGALFGILGVAVAAAGGWLVSLGGSPYYLIAGLALLATGVLLARRSAAALWLYAALLLGSTAWAVWEIGVDWWPLAARLDVLFVLGFWLATPWMRRSLLRGAVAPAAGAAPVPAAAPPATVTVTVAASRLRMPRVALGLALLVSAAVAVASWFTAPHELAGRLGTEPVAGAAQAAPSLPDGEWHAYGRTGYGQRFSPLAQITPANASQLQMAWEYRTGDLRGKDGDPEETTYEVTPLKIGNRLFLCTPHQSVIALDATTGKQLWRYDPEIENKLALQHLTCRGLSYQPPRDPVADASPAALGAVAGIAAGGERAEPAQHASPTTTQPAAPAEQAAAQRQPPIAAQRGPKDPACRAKLFMPTADGRVIALNPDSGAVCTNFGGGTGQIDLWQRMPNLRPGAYYSTSPVVVTQRLVIVGGTVLDNASVKEQSGVIRAFDIDTGALVWNWDSGNPDDTAPLPPGRTYTPNSPNSWSISSVDEALGMVYVPMGNQPPDQWGGNRSPAVERYSSSVVALDLDSGRVRWHFQTVHHDLWDYDVPSQPTLIDLQVGGQTVPALVQPTKQGELFVLDRRTGTPVLPVQEHPAPQGAAKGDRTAPTQPKSALSFDPPPLRERDMWGGTMFDQLACRIAFHRLRYEGRFTPPSEQGSIVYPGNFGVFNWGGIAVDPQRQVAFTTPTYLAFVSKLVPRKDDTSLMVQEGGPPKGSLPALNENFGAPFAASMKPFMSPVGLPCQAPPWGYVAGVDLRTGEVAWKHRNGTVRDLSPLPLPFRMGVPGIGGPMLTGGGVAFYSGALDNYVRAYDLTDGRMLWQDRLPAGGQATPMSYTGEDGRQYVVVVAGGHGSTGTKPGDSVRAYAVPAQK
ncbi:glucose/quinate/shikimate family membrane-bound PQQ-dependent dehydrogenase [Acidovorax sp. NCPPB 4044]|uniref:glucose/quinate/shikimate family membrane-bound PQQ-dependent dehydrogenase n=1 Tax=Acidovorax sp. NCPPB 4044 TaxID=2940490 RepID=UPI00230277B5|nr:glucose/quinate/shikimate family membrane-bound PQQ-dependent dehydrogenase [Acidovorax sp. NCPPB 4044]MDA8522880.1 glucose/quinate/shikimate family membrane-bound PQQ-dependent dehydrogenase [Acidovorax sp. NCPPB 4044]